RVTERTMHGCHGCQELMLEHLYDLLEEADQQALHAHLAGCPECQAALEKARAQQALLAAAARMPSIDVRFTPPAPETTTPTGLGTVVSDAPGGSPQGVDTPRSPGTQGVDTPRSPDPQPVRTLLLPVRPQLRKPRAWQGWALAASLLVLAGGITVP